MAATTKVWVNNLPPTAEDVDLNGFKNENNNLIVGSGQALDTGDSQQTNKAVAHYASAGQIYVDSGAANAYVLSAGNSRENIPAYVDRAKFLFVPDNANTGASTVNIGGLGVKDLNDGNGVALLSGRLITNKEVTIEYILASDECRLVVPLDFEEGVWTPELWDDSLSGLEGQTYDAQVGYYTKIGNRISINGYMTLSGLGTLTTGNRARIGNLPFTSNSTTYSDGGIWVYSGTLTTILQPATGIIAPSTNYILLEEWTTNGTADSLNIGIDFGSTDRVQFFGQYLV